MNNKINQLQKKICDAYGVEVHELKKGTRIAFALNTLDQIPIYGIREKQEGNMCGWYIHGGEWSDDPNFYQPVCIEHIEET